MTAQVITAFAFGVAFVLALLVLAVVFPRPTPFQYLIFRVVLALAAAGVAAMIPGFVKIELTQTAGLLLSAGGALAVFVVVYFLNPGRLLAHPDAAPDMPPQQTQSEATLVLSRLTHPGLAHHDHDKCVLKCRLVNTSALKAVVNGVRAYVHDGSELAMNWSNRIDPYGNPQDNCELLCVVDSEDLFLREVNGREITYCRVEVSHSLSEQPLVGIFDEYADWIGQQTDGEATSETARGAAFEAPHP